jgi:betaine-aldehyde dehydrogenase
MSQLSEQKLYIAGRYVSACSGETFDTINPATGPVIGSVQQAGQQDVETAARSSGI